MEREGEEVRRLLFAPKPHLGYGIISFFCVLASEGMSAIVFGERGERGQKVVAYYDVIFTMLNLFLSFTGDKMMPQAITLHDKFIIILSQYIIFPNEISFRVSSRLLTSPP